MIETSSTPAREFAQEVVSKLRAAGFEALWAGGCVRDQELHLVPKDYDVATSATPDDIRKVFGKRKTLPIGAAFGVITVLGPRSAGQIEVATFRRDATYSDGRHPDSVAFSNAEEDARRRDFTINGMFYDPLAGEVIDYVGGQADLEACVIRAIGDAEERLDEDKLRMLRAVRFATTLGFTIEAATMAAIQHHAAEISVVSAERITAELRRLLQSKDRKRGLELLLDSGLLGYVLPELSTDDASWNETLQIADCLTQPSMSVCVAVLLRSIYFASTRMQVVDEIGRQWKLSNDEIAGVRLCLANESTICNATAVAWPELQRVLTLPRIGEVLDYSEAVSTVTGSSPKGIELCRNTLLRPEEEWNPRPLINGDDLKRIEIPAGPAYQDLLTAVRDAQLVGDVSDYATALALADKLWQQKLAD